MPVNNTGFFMSFLDFLFLTVLYSSPNLTGYLRALLKSVALHHYLFMTVRFRLNHPSKPGERAILVELYIDSKIRPEISTGEKVLTKHWAGTRATSKAPDYHRLNDNLSRIERELTQLWRDNLNDLSKIKALMPIVVRGVSSSNQKKRIWEAWEKFDTNNKLQKRKRHNRNTML
jgi:hypothetical protein